jgi:cell division protein FtsB
MLSFINTLPGRFAIGAAIGLLVLVAFLSFRLQGAEAKIAARDAVIAQTIAANETLVASNEALRKQATRDGAILRELHSVQTRLAADADRRRIELDRLAENDPDVASFLDMPIPAALRVPDAPSGDADGDSADSGE